MSHRYKIRACAEPVVQQPTLTLLSHKNGKRPARVKSTKGIYGIENFSKIPKTYKGPLLPCDLLSGRILGPPLHALSLTAIPLASSIDSFVPLSLFLENRRTKGSSKLAEFLLNMYVS